MAKTPSDYGIVHALRCNHRRSKVTKRKAVDVTNTSSPRSESSIVFQQRSPMPRRDALKLTATAVLGATMGDPDSIRAATGNSGRQYLLISLAEKMSMSQAEKFSKYLKHVIGDDMQVVLLPPQTDAITEGDQEYFAVGLLPNIVGTIAALRDAAGRDLQPEYRIRWFHTKSGLVGHVDKRHQLNVSRFPAPLTIEWISDRQASR